MNNSLGNFDLKALFESLRENVSKFGGFNPQVVREAGLLTEDKLVASILRALEAGAKTGNEIMTFIGETSTQGAKAGAVYPMLENLQDTGLVTAKVKGDRKVFQLTPEGLAAFEKLGSNPEAEEVIDAESWPWPKWVDLRGVVPTASARLAKVTLEVTQHGTKEQQQQAAEALDEARKRIHAILAAD
jgi:DNA-binding PadR family transcriptional regulator